MTEDAGLTERHPSHDIIIIYYPRKKKNNITHYRSIRYVTDRGIRQAAVYKSAIGHYKSPGRPLIFIRESPTAAGSLISIQGRPSFMEILHFLFCKSAGFSVN